MMMTTATLTMSTPAVRVAPLPSRQWTYQDYLNLPDDGKRYEIIEGVLYMANAPSSTHQYLVGEIFAELRYFANKNKLGQVTIAPFEVHLSETSRPIQPDVFFVRAARWPSGEIAYFEGAPDLVVEVISPSSTRVDRYTKFRVYEQSGVQEYWLINPRLQTVEIFTLVEGEYALWGEFRREDTVTSGVLVGLEISCLQLFR
jgi:Uma2 family endonuclease